MPSVGPEPVDGVRIAPQGGYLAKRCPEAVQLDILRPVEPLPTSEFMTMLAEDGIEFEGEVFDTLRSTVAGAVDVDRALHRDVRAEVTIQALRAGAPLVIGGRLPVDDEAHRVGEPDLLVRVGARPKADGRWAFVAVDVKHHIVRDLDDASSADAIALLGLAPWVETDGADSSAAARWRDGDLLQLAHYQRLLEACGHGTAEGRWGGIIGSGRSLSWFDLDAPRWGWSEYLEGRVDVPLSSMDSYDVAFAHRLSVIDAALRHQLDPTLSLAAEPVAIKACPECGWRVWCAPRLEETSDLSILLGMNLHKRRLHRDRGVNDLHDLARLDDTTARLLAAGVDLVDLVERAAQVDPATPIAEIVPRRHRQVADLAGEGFRVASDLDRLCGRTFRYHDAQIGDLPGQIDGARARLGPRPAYRRRGVDELDIPRGDIEIDIDMESAEDGTYLWGVLHTERDLGGAPVLRYLPFVSWVTPASTAEIDAFARFWAWLRDQREHAARSGRSLRAYCYSKGAENTQMSRLARSLGLEDEVDAFLDSGDWVDLLAVLRGNWSPGGRWG